MLKREKPTQKEKKKLVPYAILYYELFKDCTKKDLRKEINNIRTAQIRCELLLLILNKIDLEHGGKGWLCPVPLRKSSEAFRTAFPNDRIQNVRFT